MSVGEMVRLKKDCPLCMKKSIIARQLVRVLVALLVMLVIYSAPLSHGKTCM